MKTSTTELLKSLPSAAPPMISIAGIRGVIGHSLNLDEFAGFAQAFLADIEPRVVVVGSDTRASGEMMRHLLFAAAIASGVKVIDLGVVPTPTVGLMTRQLKAGGGVVISASHNPPQWNAFKFFSSEGTFLSPGQFERMLANAWEKKYRRATIDAKLNQLGSVEKFKDPIAAHLKTLLAALPVAAIRRRKFRVVLDACNGAGLHLSEALFKALGVTLRVIHSTQDGRFERPPEPLPENLNKLKTEVKRFKAHVGFALDPDADRLAIVDETGRAIGEERTIVLAIDAILNPKSGVKILKISAKAKKAPVVVNLSTTRAVEDVAKKYGASVHRTKIGEAHVVGEMQRSKSLIGGEGNGGVIFPAVHFGRDSATGMGLLLASLATSERKAKLSALNATIPDYIILKDKVDLPDRARVNRALEKLRGALSNLRNIFPKEIPATDSNDGFKIILSDRWVHIRASGTEPIMRLFAEAPTKKGAEQLLAWAKASMA